MPEPLHTEIPTSCRAAVQVADRTIEMRTLPVPQTLPPGHALIRVEACGMCGSDIEQYHGSVARAGTFSYPAIPGHEPVGRIALMDTATLERRGLALGQRVAVHGTAPCGVCRNCRAGGRCLEAFSYGFRSLEIGVGLWGGYSEYMVITPQTKLYPLAEHLSVADAVLFNPLAAGFDWVCRLAQLDVGEDILILGPGQRGLACVIAAREAGAERIIVTGLARDRPKLALARELGATDTIVVDEDDTLTRVLAITQGRGAHRVVDTTPTSFQPVTDAIAAARRGGTLVLAGLKAHTLMPDFPLDAVIHKQLHLVGALSASDWAVQQAIRAVAGGRYPLHLLHSHTLPITEVEKAIQLLAGEIEDGTLPLHITVVP